MSGEVVVALCSLAGTLGGSVLGILGASKLTGYRIEQLERKVDRLGALVERVAVVERDQQAVFRLLDENRARVTAMGG